MDTAAGTTVSCCRYHCGPVYLSAENAMAFACSLDSSTDQNTGRLWEARPRSAGDHPDRYGGSFQNAASHAEYWSLSRPNKIWDFSPGCVAISNMSRRILFSVGGDNLFEKIMSNMEMQKNPLHLIGNCGIIGLDCKHTNDMCHAMNFILEGVKQL